MLELSSKAGALEAGMVACPVVFEMEIEGGF